MNDKKTTIALWAVYISLLAVLLPHTAWAFSLFEKQTPAGLVVAWLAAAAFEFAIAVLTHKLSRHISETPNSKRPVLRFQRRYLNAYAAGLLIAIGVSTLANLAHAVEFGQSMAIFVRYGIPFGVYAVAFGAVLPITSLLFARVLANVQESEHETDPELESAKSEAKELRRQLREQGRIFATCEAELREAQTELMLVRQLSADDKAGRILAARELWPDAPQSAWAHITDTSPGYVSEVVRGTNGHGEKVLEVAE